MIKDVNLIGYLPPFLQHFKEYELIMNAENPDYQLLVDESERLKNNQYILTSDSEGLERFESFFNFNIEEDEDLEFRRSRLMSHWNDIYPYTYESLISKLRSLHGENSFRLNPQFKIYELGITTNLERPGQVSEFDYLLDYMMPANIKLHTYNEIFCFAEGSSYGAIGLVNVQIIEFTDAYDSEHKIEGTHKVASGHSTTHTRELTDAYYSSHEMEGHYELAGHQGFTRKVEMTDAYNSSFNTKGNFGVGGSKTGTATVELTDAHEVGNNVQDTQIIEVN